MTEKSHTPRTPLRRRLLIAGSVVAIGASAVGQMRAGFPDIGASRVIERWAGAMMTMLDNRPVISAVEGRPGLFVGSGFYYALTMAPAAGEALADLVMGHKPQFDLKLYRVSRFSDGSPMVFRS
jgi:glycine/D-amino acid oxidase-like deaminating enzyme